MKKINYYVIGGQYEAVNYGGTETLLGAKRLASNHEEYWDNYQGWHKPRIFDAKDCKLETNFFGEGYYPIADAEPVAKWNPYTKRWEEGGVN